MASGRSLVSFLKDFPSAFGGSFVQRFRLCVTGVLLGVSEGPGGVDREAGSLVPGARYLPHQSRE